MRFNELQLTRYGHFTERTLLLPKPSGDAPDIHIVHGPNEAGKSTISNAMVDFLYGIPAGTRYAFQHELKILEISASIQTAGNSHTLKRLGKQLRDNQDNLLDAQFIDTQNLSRDDYVARFWLDDASLKQGGESILNHKGELGAALFAATTGLNTLQAQINSLLASTDEFYKPKKRTNLKVKTLNDALKAVRKEIKALDTNKAAWAKLKTAQAAAQERLATTQDALKTLQTKQKRHEAIKTALIAFNTWESNQKALSTEESSVPSNWAVDFPKLREKRQHLTMTLSSLNTEIKQTTDQINKSDLNNKWLAYKDEMDLLRQSTQAYRQDQSELQNTQKTLDNLLSEIDRRNQTLNDFPLGQWSPSTAISSQTIDRIDPLIERWKMADTTLRQMVSNQQAISTKLKQATERNQSTTDQTSNEMDFSFNSRTHLDRLKSALEHGPSKELLQELKSNNDRLKDYDQQAFRLKANLDTAHLGNGTELHSLRVPSIEAVDRFIEQGKSLITEQDRLEKQASDEKAKMDSAERRLEKLGHNKENNNDLTLSRDELFTAWNAHKTLIREPVKLTEISKTAQSFDDVLNRYDLSVTQHLANAENSGQIIEILEAQKDFAAAQAATTDNLHATKAKIDTLKKDQANLIKELPNLSFDDPSALKKWIAAHSAWQDADRDKKAQQLRVDNCVQACNEYAKELEQLIHLTAPAIKTDNAAIKETLAETVAKAATVARRCEKAWDTHVTLSQQQQELNADLTRINEELEHEKKLQIRVQNETVQLLQSSWAESVPFEQLCHHWHEVKSFSSNMREKQALEDRIGVLQVKLDETDARVNQLATLFLKAEAAELQSSPLTQLNHFHAQQIERHTEVNQHKKRIQQLNETLSKTLAEVTSIDALLKPFQDHFHLEDLDELQIKLDHTARLQMLQEEQHRLEKTITEQLACTSFAEAQSELQQAIKDLNESLNENYSEGADVRQRMEDTLTELNIEIQSTDQKRTEAQTHLGDIERQLHDIALDEKIAQLRQQEADLEVEIEDGVRNALKLRLGFRAIERGLQHFRNQNQSGMLASAKQAFIALTGGDYTDLVTRPTDKNTEELIATKANGATVLAAAMSKGTRDQLYLALRIASYHEYRQHRSPLPFIADDIFETFDDSRTEHALNEFANMARHGQIIYFTHHRYVADIAQRLLPNVNTIELAS